MMPLLFSLDLTLPLFQPLCDGLPAEAGDLEYRHFPDGESYLRVGSEVIGRNCIVLADLSRADSQFLPLQFLAATLRELGARSVGLVAPYLCYMRQDRRFHTGEALTSRLFARWISQEMDWMITVDPHLHRYHSLAEIYSIPTRVLAGAPALAEWLSRRGEACLLVGPDAESRQWVEGIAAKSGLPFIVGRKERRGDRDVTVKLPDITNEQAALHSALIVDDVISSGHTILQTISELKSAGFSAIDCMSVHGIFAGDARQQLLNAGLRNLIVSNSIPGQSPAIDLSPLLLEPIHEMLASAHT
ncbi:ribose-phosphate pyrophosphokinase [Microbulbifer donghaiensis]|uniref:Ribose-phosphate pyrophosphokinase n=1 Tax=Microbulbifer donghaiensis TaxID=494016 RepID=A0A1M5G1I0_9GAMM|nr:ribose-phosphate diphosphokinase [Microbulbifer donghaiensis]SHF97569.1 ribose-phosphate pyrophosphokinase [Microbulbifer donghaiensis]